MTCFVILHYLVAGETISTVDSILNNVNGELHIIIVDNCSPNDSFEALVKKYQSENRVSVIKNQRNDGYAKGINFGYDYAKVKEPYIMFADQDDVWLSDKIQKTYAVMKKTEKKWDPYSRSY